MVTSTRRTSAIIGGLALVVGTLVAIAGPTTGAAASAPAISVSPHTGLADRDDVTVSGIGFAPRHTISVQQCAPTVGACRFTNLIAPTDGTGTFGRTVRVRRLIGRADGPAIDCATTVCRIVATDQSHPVSSVDAILTFDPTAPFSPAPTVTITPDSDLPPEAVVTLRGSGFARNAQLEVAECASGAPADRCIGLSLETTDATGGLEAPARISRLPFGTDLDCLTVGCVLRVVDASRGDVAGAPLAFDPTIPVPTVDLDPAGPLPYRGHVTAVMHHFTPGHSYAAAECYGRGGCDPETTGTADPSGDLRLRVAIRRIVNGLSDEGPYPIDCATNAYCVLTIEPGDGNGLERLTTHLVFDPTTRPTVRVGSTTVRETDGPQYAQVPVTLDAQSNAPVSVRFTTYGFTAGAGTDFIAASGTLVIPPGTTRGAIAIVVLGDNHHERPETLLVVISDPANTTIADDDAVLTIHDDD